MISCDEIPLHEQLTSTETEEKLTVEKFCDTETPHIVLKNHTISEDGKSFVWTRKISLDSDKIKIIDHVTANEAMHFRNHLHLPYARTGYVDYFAPCQPVMDDGKTIHLRRQQRLQTVTLDKAATIEYRPYTNEKNRTDVCVYAERTYFAKEFTSTTVIQYH